MTDIQTKIDLGCGENKPDGFFGVDIIDTNDADHVIDLDEGDWNLPENHFTVVRAFDVFEHLRNPINFMEEVHRIAKDGARVILKSPHLSSQNWIDPTHKRLVGRRTIDHYFTDDGRLSFYTPVSFSVESASLQFLQEPVLFWNYVIEPFVNVSESTQRFYEESFLSRLFPAKDIVFNLRVKK